MSTRNISRRSAIQGYANSTNAPIYVDSDDNILKMIPAGSGTTEVELVDGTSTQTISGNKTFTGTVVMSGAVTKTEFADGTVSLPSMTFSDDLNSGIYRIGADNVGVAVAGAKVLDVSATGLGVTGTVTATAGIDFNGLTPAASPISLTGVTLASSTNAIRGVDIVPTRVSGWTCFTGTLSGVSAYMDYREMHTAATDVVYGEGLFGFMDSGASASTILSLQAITTVSAGATLTTAGGSPLSGAYAAQFKTLFDGATADSGAITAVACFLYQSNVTDISGKQSSILQLSVDSGLLQNIIHLNCGASALSTYFLNVSTSTSPFLSWGADNQPNAAAADLGIRCKIGSSEYWIPLYVNT